MKNRSPDDGMSLHVKNRSPDDGMSLHVLNMDAWNESASEKDQ